ncbi:MAG: DUF2461 domain-containing protein [Bacteroidia bacterium]
MSHLNENYRKFFMELAPNNTSEWFNENRKRYEKDVKVPFQSLVSDLIIQLAKIDKALEGTKASDCIFRINRDIRFSKDKTPYKVSMSAAIAPGGRKNMTYPGFYFEATPEGITMYGGVYMAEKPQLDAIRNLIANNLKQFETLITEPNFKKEYGGEILGEKQVRLAPELKEAAEKQPLIFNKQFYYKASLDETYLTKENLTEILCGYFITAQPVSQFLCKVL